MDGTVQKSRRDERRRRRRRYDKSSSSLSRFETQRTQKETRSMEQSHVDDPHRRRRKRRSVDSSVSSDESRHYRRDRRSHHTEGRTDAGRRSSRKRQRFQGDSDTSESEPVIHHRKGRDRRREHTHRRHERRNSSTTRSDDGEPSHRREAPGARSGVVSDDEDQGHSSSAFVRSADTRKSPPRLKVDRGDHGRRIVDRHNTPLTAPHTLARAISKPKDDSTGHFYGGKGAVIADRYKIIREVGVGTFGRVVECLNLNRNDRSSRRHRHCDTTFVALKIVRNVRRYHDSALVEADIVETVNRHGGRGMTHCVILHEAFSFQGHFCLVFESLGPSLYDVLKKNDYKPFPMVCVQDFTIQLLEVLEFLHGECRIVHTDLKIENILLMNDREVMHENQRVPESTRLKLIDFGGACYDRDKKSSVINTRQYRAPEVILGTGWSMPSDMWSVGCILAELYQGELLFATHDNVEHLALIDRIIGPFPRRMIRAAKTNGVQMDLANEVFDSDGRHRMGRILSDEDLSFVRKAPSLEYLIRQRDTWFLELLRKILMIDPNERSTAHECLQFLSKIRRNNVRYCK